MNKDKVNESVSAIRAHLDSIEREMNVMPMQKDVPSAAMIQMVLQLMCVDTMGKMPGNIVTIAQAVRVYCMQYSVDPILCLAQGIVECHFGCNPQAVRSRKTMNIFNVGNTDDGANRQMESWEQGIECYCRLMAREYLWRDMNTSGWVTMEMMAAHDFNRPKGGRYATAPDYTKQVTKVAGKVSKLIMEVI